MNKKDDLEKALEPVLKLNAELLATCCESFLKEQSSTGTREQSMLNLVGACEAFIKGVELHHSYKQGKN